ncbi:MAG TPA: GWxTD domain-containing protein, partial [bacterium]|nr:GWxTD domain-containing protein [bacterium]
VYYYIEIYNLQENFTGQFFSIKRTVLDGSGLPIFAIPSYTKKKRIRMQDDVEVGMFSIGKLPSGRYQLYLAVVDSIENQIASVNTNFYVHNPAVTQIAFENMPIEQQMASSEVALLSAEDLDMFLGATQYLVDSKEKKIIEKLENETAKQLYLYRYWKQHDPLPETRVLESFMEFIERVHYANANFSQIRRIGWKTDRGRIMIKYGKPAEVQYYANVPDFKEFQAWSYDGIEGGVVFIFGVTGGFGDLNLIHSTKTGEVHNEFWLDLLKVTEGRTGISNMAPGAEDRQAIRNFFRRYNLEWPRYLR